MRHFFRSIVHSIHSLIYWFPVIWRDKDWDHDFFMDILIHKLSSMERYFRSSSIAMEGEEYADEILAVLQKLLAFQHQLNEDAALELHEQKWGEAEWHSEPHGDKGYTRVWITYPNAWTSKENELASRELSDALDDSIRDDEVTLQEAFDLIAENVQKWWD